MYIDFHTHAFTDPIAEKAISKLEKTILESGLRNVKPPVTRGTVRELLEKMDECGIDKSVLLPIATKPSQQTVINDWAAGLDTDRIIPFGTVHPDAEDAMHEIERIRALGLKGVKLHPDYQGFFADEERMFPIYRKCAAEGLPVILHAGLDAAFMDCVHCTPLMGAHINDEVPELTLILAHMGGNEMWDDTEKYLAGRDLYLDTAYTGRNIPEETALRIIKKHGADKILFASDCPWHSPGEERELIERLPLASQEKEMIFSGNARRLLGI